MNSGLKVSVLNTIHQIGHSSQTKGLWNTNYNKRTFLLIILTKAR